MRALEGIKVLDLSRVPPGLFCTMILADFGADVLRIENPGAPLELGTEGSEGFIKVFDASIQTMFSPFNALNRNKRSLGLNLKNNEARSIFLKMVETADVVIEGFRPGVSERLGIDYRTLRKINSRIIYCAITGFGQDGPYRLLPGHDINYIGTAGVLGMIGKNEEAPAIPLNLIGDFAGGSLQGVIGILLALAARERTGKGQFVDVSITDGAVSLLSLLLSESFSVGQTPQRGQTVLSGAEPFYDVYLTQDGKYLSVGCIEPWFYANLCKALGRDDLLSLQGHPAQRGQLRAALKDVFITRTRDEWFDLLRGQNICVGKVNTLVELESDPQLAHRRMIVEIDDPAAGRVKQVGIPIKLSDTPGDIRNLTPSLGQHTEEILRELGYDECRIDQLRDSGAIG